MAKPTTEELKSELQNVVNELNQANQVIAKCNRRAIEIQAIIEDRTTPESDAT
jgi:hypothetical protein